MNDILLAIKLMKVQAMADQKNPSNQNQNSSDYYALNSNQIGGFFGTISEHGTHVWQYDGKMANLIGVDIQTYNSEIIIGVGEDLQQALKRAPMFVNTSFTIHKMELPPDTYYPRMSRPFDRQPLNSIGRLPNCEEEINTLIGTLNQIRYLIQALDDIFQSVHPTKDNMKCYGTSIRNILILACTECEAQWRGVLEANDFCQEKTNTNSYVKLSPAMRLSEYSVQFRQFPWLDPVRPFEKWDKEDPTRTIPWYSAYNYTKHHRERDFNLATLESAIQAVAATWIMVAAQFGIDGVLEFEDLARYFRISSAPNWEHKQVYTSRNNSINNPKSQLYKF